MVSVSPAANEVGDNVLGGAAEKIGEGLRGLERAWWLWEWLCEEVLRDADKKVAGGLYRNYNLPLLAMSEEQLSALLAKLKDDAGLQEKLKGAADLDAAVAI